MREDNPCPKIIKRINSREICAGQE